MKLGEIVSRLVIDPQKLTEYALNLENPQGGDKAVIFQRRLGFTQDNYELLLNQISNQALDAEAILGRNDEHGQRYTVDLEIIGIQGQQEIVRTGWIVEPGSDGARLVTL
ncbi:DUF6883 domain-containing protein [Microseira wollei]|uniref:DUF6883 domain-containing protein n=1 Tax=Microseira wollei NIES-4236 TaxID=2530354 RepID=A0AAV3XE84_9CYAN|nr:DUF6883 domain-containing protein [Microseira wollei]GET40639.1 hypothetical protein MiSe_54500 [Microseira wollei NIES-4236]